MNFDPGYVFTEIVRIYLENKDKPGKVIICNEGSSRCFATNTIVKTVQGNKKISEIKMGDFVLTHNEEKKINEYKKVLETLEMINKKPCYRITLKNGKIIEATQDHEIYFEGAWRSLKYVVSSWNERQNFNKR